MKQREGLAAAMIIEGGRWQCERTTRTRGAASYVGTRKTFTVIWAQRGEPFYLQNSNSRGASHIWLGSRKIRLCTRRSKTTYEVRSDEPAFFHIHALLLCTLVCFERASCPFSSIHVISNPITSCVLPPRVIKF